MPFFVHIHNLSGNKRPKTQPRPKPKRAASVTKHVTPCNYVEMGPWSLWISARLPGYWIHNKKHYKISFLTVSISQYGCLSGAPRSNFWDPRHRPFAKMAPIFEKTILIHPRPRIHVKNPLSGNFDTRFRIYKVVLFSNLGDIYVRKGSILFSNWPCFENSLYATL